MQVNQNEKLGCKTNGATKGSSTGKEASKSLDAKLVGVAVAGETPSPTAQFVGEIQSVLEHTKNHPPGNQHQEGPVCLWIVKEVSERWQRAEQAAL